MTRANVTAAWLALLIVAATEAGMEQGRYRDMAMQMHFQKVESVVEGKQRRVQRASRRATQAQIAANKAENIQAQFLTALAIAGVAGAFHTSGVWWILMGGSIFAAGRAGYQAAQAMGVL